MPAILILTSAVGVVTSFLTLLSQTNLWQRKEYRWDRLLSFLRSPDWLRSLLPFIALGVVLTDIGWIVSLITPTELVLAESIGRLALLSFLAHHLVRIKYRGVFRPAFTLKALAIIVLTILITLFYLQFTLTMRTLVALQWATVIFFLPIFVAVAVLLINLPAALRKRQRMHQAKQLRQSLSHLTVIGITGSVGKTSTKHFLAQILATPDNSTLATAEHRNSSFTVALDMLHQLTPQTRLYIAEMAAYHRGEIKAITNIAQPQIGVVTAIGNQHLDLFGSLDAIAKTKWELIEALPASGTAVLNADDPTIASKGAHLAIKTVWYSTKKKADVYATNITVHPQAISCELHLKDDSRFVTIPLAGQGALQNAVAAAAAAMAVGLAPARIFERLQQLQAFPRTMEIQKNQLGATIIDNSYSASEAGVLNALEHLQHFPQPDKRIVIVPLIELGSAATAVHERIGQALAKTQATVYVYGDAYRNQLTAPSTKFFNHPAELLKKVGANLNKDTVILLEGRIPTLVRDSLLK